MADKPKEQKPAEPRPRRLSRKEREFEFYRRFGDGPVAMTLPRGPSQAQEIPEPEKAKE